MMLEFIAVHREDIIRRCRMKISMRLVPPPTEAELDHGVPLFLEQLVDALRLGPSSIAAIRGTALLHGHDFTVAQVVRDYGDVCQSITELAVELNAPIAAGDLRTLNRCLDDAIAGAIIEHGRHSNPGRNRSGGSNFSFGDGSVRYIPFGRSLAPYNLWAVTPLFRTNSVAILP